jgi:hypothetical protein
VKGIMHVFEAEKDNTKEKRRLVCEFGL